MVKAILKRIFPIKILKNAFLIYNSVKSRTIDRVFFSEKTIHLNDFLVYRETNPFLQEEVQVSHLPQSIQEKLGLWLDKNWTQDEYLLALKEPGYIDPDYGWAIAQNNKLIYPSLGFSRAPYVRKPDIFKSYFSNKAVYYDKIISLRDTGEENYFHFYNDVLPKLLFIMDRNIDINPYTIVISRKLFDKEYFKHVFQKTWLKNLKWHVQTDEKVYFDEAIFCKPLTHSKKYFDTVAKMMSADVSAPPRSRRVFLTRSPRSLRFIENLEEIKYILDANEFEIVDTEKLSIEDQIALFANCESLISIHGAGITNIIFRKSKPLSLLEIIHPSSYIPFHYIMLAHIYGYRYSAILGEEGSQKHYGGFRIDPKKFLMKVESLVNSLNYPS